MWLPVSLFSQGEVSQWYFGDRMSLDFSSGYPVPSTGELASWEGSSSMSDQNGNLLFYTDGMTVYNRNQLVMQNGSGLKGSETSTQSALIIPAVDAPSLYYIFTTAGMAEAGGLNYSVVDMNGDGGNGSVEQKNTALISPVAEKVSAVRHCNGKDIWVMTRAYNSDAYYAYLVTAAGVSSTPVISHASYLGGSGVLDYSGVLKFSPDGSRVVCVNFETSVEFSDFDNSTGIVSNTIDLTTQNLQKGFGAEFSPDSRLLYVVNASSNPATALIQFDITAGSAAGILASEVVIGKAENPTDSWVGIQLGPDGKIYMITDNNLSIVEFPAVKGKGCKLKMNAVNLNGMGRTSLPGFMTSYLDRGFSANNTCNTLEAGFSYNKPENIVSVEWDFGDPASGGNNRTSVDDPTHIFSTPGEYSVSLIRTNKCGVKDTAVQTLAVYTNFEIELGNDTMLCDGELLVLNNANLPIQYYWQDEYIPKPNYVVLQAGKYFAEARYGTCVQYDSINIQYTRLPFVSLGPDVKLCTGDQWNSTILPDSGFHYVWENGSTDLMRTIAVPGKYYLTSSGMCGEATDTIQITKGMCSVWLPNAFTPNGDGINEYYRVGGGDKSANFQMQIFNRWGHRVFVSDSNEKGWNGLINGKEAPVGTYVCVIKYTDYDTGENKTVRGIFMLIR